MFVREQSGETLTSWRTDVKDAAVAARIAHADAPTFTGAVKLTINFFVPRPPSVKPDKRPYPIVAPDLDKLVRGVGDALKQAGVYKDDSQVVGIQATKSYATDDRERSPGAWITVTEIV